MIKQTEIVVDNTNVYTDYAVEDLEPFDLERFREGELALTAGGDTAKFLHMNDSQWPVSAKITRETGTINQCFKPDGRWLTKLPSHRDLTHMKPKVKK